MIIIRDGELRGLAGGKGLLDVVLGPAIWELGSDDIAAVRLAKLEGIRAAGWLVTRGRGGPTFLLTRVQEDMISVEGEGDGSMGCPHS